MTLTVKLGPELEQSLAQRSAERGVPKSVVVKEALAEYLLREPVAAYAAGKDLFGRHGSGEGMLSARRRSLYAATVDAKQRRRR
ncbi:MAG: ribbon-helix-helix protein, CopG family [Betaproteobacteria bacterium]|nr:ribbon-helix-helix protein, CopG family [Betaproteobacteria bacterium]